MAESMYAYYDSCGKFPLAIAAWRTLPWLASEWGCWGRRFSETEEISVGGERSDAVCIGIGSL
jgi:hypothetical protein